MGTIQSTGRSSSGSHYVLLLYSPTALGGSLLQFIYVVVSAIMSLIIIQ